MTHKVVRLVGQDSSDRSLRQLLQSMSMPLHESDDAVPLVHAGDFAVIINERGFYVDRALVKATRDLAHAEQASINTEIAKYGGVRAFALSNPSGSRALAKSEI
jgi:hypothetical protein